MLEAGRKIRVFEVRTVQSEDLPLELADRAISLGKLHIFHMMMATARHCGSLYSLSTRRSREKTVAYTCLVMSVVLAGRERAKVEGGWVSLTSADGTVLLQKSLATSVEPEEQSGNSESDDAAGVGFAKAPRRSMSGTAPPRSPKEGVPPQSETLTLPSPLPYNTPRLQLSIRSLTWRGFAWQANDGLYR